MLEKKINDSALAFISDWRKRFEKQQKRYVISSTAAFIIAFAVCLSAFFWFQNRNYTRIINQNMNYIQDSAIQESNQIEHEMENVRIFVENLAGQYALLSLYNSGATIEERLEMLSDRNIFDRIAYISPDGKDTSLEGTANVADREYFIKALNGESGWQMLQESRVTKQSTVVFYAPIYVDGKIIGVMAGFYGEERLNDLFSYQLFNYEPNTYLLLGDGTVVANSQNDKVIGNMLDKLSQKTFVGATDYEQIREIIEDEERTTITFSFIDENKTSVGVIVQFSNSDWMILSVLPHNITSEMLSRANQAGTILLITIVSGVLLLIFVLLYFLNRQKGRFKDEMGNATDNLKVAIRDGEKKLSIIESLGNVFSSIYYVVLVDGRYQRIKDNEADTDKDNVLPEGVVNEGFAAYIENNIIDADKEKIYKFLEISTLSSYLEENDLVSLEYQRRDGGWRRLLIVPAGRDEDGTINSVVFALQKIDAEKQRELQTKKALQEAYEAAQMANEAKTTFLSNMSHDIRTPMNAIVGMTAIAASNIDNPEKVSDCLKKITSSSKLLLGLINEVLDMSKIESGKVDLFEEEFQLSDLIDSLISINQPLIKEKNHTLIVKINNVVHENVIGDITRLQQVFTNILSNAVKYTPNNGKIEITLSEKDNNEEAVGWYEIVFKDNGIGMSEEFQKNLFEPFTRAKDKRIVNIQGTGLGMPITKNIINMMNGNVTVQSRINEGTTVTISFALRLQQKEEDQYEEFIGLPVLVVDDDVISCESVCDILNSLSMSSEWVTSGREAVQKIAERHERQDDYYAVIVDWKMPDMNGVETTKEIRRRVGQDIPIIVISAYDWSDIEQEARDAGINAFLGKPLFKSRIVGLFSGLVENKHKAPQNMKEELKEYDFSGKRILLAEDNEINREIAVEILSMAGFTTETAENGKLCVEMFTDKEQGYYDIILMDIQMPEMDGYEAAKNIRALSHPDAKTIPIIAMTANAFTSDVRDALNSGMNGHISKPIDVNRLIKVLNENIGNK